MGEDKQTGRFPKWSKEEEQFLIKNYRKMKMCEIGQQLNRTSHAVQLRSARLKLKERQTFTPPPKQSNEMWRKTPYESYWVTDTGMVWDAKRAVGLKPIYINSGVHSIQLRIGKKQTLVSVGRLVWISFKGEIPKGYVVAFKDRNSANADLTNLLLMKRGDLMRFGYGTTQWIIQTDDQGKRIAVYPTVTACAKKFGVSTPTVRDYLKGKRIPKKLIGIHLRIVSRPTVRELRRNKS